MKAKKEKPVKLKRTYNQIIKSKIGDSDELTNIRVSRMPAATANKLHGQHFTHVIALHQKLWIVSFHRQQLQRKINQMAENFSFKWRVKFHKKNNQLAMLEKVLTHRNNAITIKWHQKTFKKWVHPSDRHLIPKMTIDQLDEFIPNLVGLGSLRVASELKRSDQKLVDLKIALIDKQKEILEKGLSTKGKELLKKFRNKSKKGG